MVMPILQTLWKRYKRYRRAVRLGWALTGRLMSMDLRRCQYCGKPEHDLERAKFLQRNANRLFRLTHGHGNPWKPYKGH